MTMFGKSRKGFSLIEIGIVMVVIGLILAAVMKGKDVIKGAEIKEVSQNYLAKWVNAADNYYDKTGFNILGDKTDPRANKAGGSTACVPNTWGLAFTNAGIDIEKIVRTNTDNFCTAQLEGQFTTAIATTTASVDWTSVVTTATGTGTATTSQANVLEFNNVPADIARAFDTLIDGVVDGASGRVINDAGALTGATTEGWPTASAGGTATVTVILEH